MWQKEMQQRWKINDNERQHRDTATNIKHLLKLIYTYNLPPDKFGGGWGVAPPPIYTKTMRNDCTHCTHSVVGRYHCTHFDVRMDHYNHFVEDIHCSYHCSLGMGAFGYCNLDGSLEVPEGVPQTGVVVEGTAGASPSGVTSQEGVGHYYKADMVSCNWGMAEVVHEFSGVEACLEAS